MMYILESGDVRKDYIGAGMTSRRFEFRLTDHKGQHWFRLGESVMTYDQLRTAVELASEHILKSPVGEPKA